MPYHVTPRAVERQQARRTQLIEAARRLFAEHGYEATTMQQVVAAAGTSIGNCYFYFPNKESLLLAVIEQFSAEIEQIIDEAIASAPEGPDRLAIAIYAGMTALAREPYLARLGLIEAPTLALRAAAVERFTARVMRFFAAAPHLLGNLDPATVACAWQGAIFQVFEGMLSGTVVMNADAAGRFLARWNMQALGLPPQIVEQGQQAIDRFAGEQ
jgi:AcrR family transcriptional regulator